MKRVAVLFLAILILGLVPTLASAQGFLPGLPSFGGLFSGPARCGDSYAPGLPGPTFYAGWGFSDRLTSFGVGAEGVGVLNLFEESRRYDPKGVWLGLSLPLPLSDRLSIIASGWYMIPGSSGNGYATYNNSDLSRTWSTSSEWWFVDGLLAFSCGSGFSVLAGARYDSFTTHFKNPNTENFIGGLNSDTADLISQNVIPLVGLQVTSNSARSNLLVRAVGIPALVGTVKYNETFGGVERLKTSANWSGGWFLELFGEATTKAFTGDSSIGAFFRWNWAHGNANLDGDGLAYYANGVFQNDTFKLGFNRSNITVGGSLKLDFALPYF
jgi:hypothetical protein